MFLVGGNRRRPRRARFEHAIEHSPIGAGDSQHVVRRLHAPLDLERCCTRLDELGQQIDRAQIPRREQVISGRRQIRSARHIAQFVRQATGLGA